LSAEFATVCEHGAVFTSPRACECVLSQCSLGHQGTGVASDVVKVQGEDLDTPGYLRGDRVRLRRRRPRIVSASPLARSR